MVAQGPMGPVCVGNSLPIRVHYYAIKKLAALACFFMAVKGTALGPIGRGTYMHS